MQLKRLDVKASAICSLTRNPMAHALVRRHIDAHAWKEMEGRADVPTSGPLGSQLLVSHDVGPCSNQQQQQAGAYVGPRPRRGRQEGRQGDTCPGLGGYDERE